MGKRRNNNHFGGGLAGVLGGLGLGGIIGGGAIAASGPAAGVGAGAYAPVPTSGVAAEALEGSAFAETFLAATEVSTAVAGGVVALAVGTGVEAAAGLGYMAYLGAHWGSQGHPPGVQARAAPPKIGGVVQQPDQSFQGMDPARIPVPFEDNNLYPQQHGQENPSIVPDYTSFIQIPQNSTEPNPNARQEILQYGHPINQLAENQLRNIAEIQPGDTPLGNYGMNYSTIQAMDPNALAEHENDSIYWMLGPVTNYNKVPGLRNLKMPPGGTHVSNFIHKRTPAKWKYITPNHW
jgi:hypothetical protein